MSSSGNPKPTCLIGLFGLSRTFQKTSKLLFEKIIDPNKDKYDFDIIINTDLNCKGCTYGRSDTNLGISKYKYENVEYFINDLNSSYNKYNQLKDITFYNYDNTIPIFSWCLVYKRIQLILQNAFQNGKVYDIYIMLRMDIVLNNILNLDDIKNELLIITGDVVRSSIFHNRDTDHVICGNYKPFMYWTLNMINFFDSLVCKNKYTENLFSKKDICETYLIDLMNKELSIMQNITFCENTEDIVQLKHAPRFNITDNVHLNDFTIVPMDYYDFYSITHDQFFQKMISYVRLILFSNSSFILSETIQHPIHSYILR